MTVAVVSPGPMPVIVRMFGVWRGISTLATAGLMSIAGSGSKKYGAVPPEMIAVTVAPSEIEKLFGLTIKVSGVTTVILTLFIFGGLDESWTMTVVSPIFSPATVRASFEID